MIDKKWILIVFFVIFFIKTEVILAAPPASWCTNSGKKEKWFDGKCYFCFTSGVPPVLATCPTPTKILTPTPKVPTKTPTAICSSPYSCQKYTCSSGYSRLTNFSCSGIDMVCCQKNLVTPTKIPTPTKSSAFTCPYSCEKYSCSFGYTHNTNYSCSGIDMVCCQKNLITPTKIPTKSPSSTSDPSCLGGSSCYLGSSCPSDRQDFNKLCYIDDKLGRCCSTIPTSNFSCSGGSSCYLLSSCPDGSQDFNKLCYTDDKPGRCCKLINNTPTPPTLSPQDEYKLRMEATRRFVTNEDTNPIEGLAARLMATADSVSYGWSYTSALTAPVKIILGTLTNNYIGDKDAGIEVGSKFYEYEKAQMEANSAAAAAGKKRKLNVWGAIVSGAVGGIEQVDGSLMNVPSTIFSSLTNGRFDNVLNIALSNALGDVNYEIEAAKATIEVGKEAGNIASITYVGLKQLTNVNNVAGSAINTQVSKIEQFIAEHRPPPSDKVARTVYDLIMPSKDLSGKTLQEFMIDQAKENTVVEAQKEGLSGVIDGALYVFFTTPYQWFK